MSRYLLTCSTRSFISERFLAPSLVFPLYFNLRLVVPLRPALLKIANIAAIIIFLIIVLIVVVIIIIINRRLPRGLDWPRRALFPPDDIDP